jgi:hypothetical protein
MGVRMSGLIRTEGGSEGGREGGRAHLRQHLVEADSIGKSICFFRVLLVLQRFRGLPFKRTNLRQGEIILLLLLLLVGGREGGKEGGRKGGIISFIFLASFRSGINKC